MGSAVKIKRPLSVGIASPFPSRELEGEALGVLRLIVRQTERGENLDADLIERAKAIVDRYDRAMMRGHEAPGVVPFRRD